MKPRFFCEHCKNEVSARDKVCPHCGRFFSEVRCPKCGFTGEGKLFFDGCPNCGYLSSKFKDFSGGSGLELVDLRAIESKEEGLSSSFPRKESKKGKSLSLWSFLVITITLAIILGMLVYIFISLQ